MDSKLNGIELNSRLPASSQHTEHSQLVLHTQTEHSQFVPDPRRNILSRFSTRCDGCNLKVSVCILRCQCVSRDVIVYPEVSVCIQRCQWVFWVRVLLCVLRLFAGIPFSTLPPLLFFQPFFSPLLYIWSTGSTKICVWYLYVLCYICVETNFVDF